MARRKAGGSQRGTVQTGPLRRSTRRTSHPNIVEAYDDPERLLRRQRTRGRGGAATSRGGRGASRTSREGRPPSEPPSSAAGAAGTTSTSGAEPTTEQPSGEEQPPQETSADQAQGTESQDPGTTTTGENEQPAEQGLGKAQTPGKQSEGPKIDGKRASPADGDDESPSKKPRTGSNRQSSEDTEERPAQDRPLSQRNPCEYIQGRLRDFRSRSADDDSYRNPVTAGQMLEDDSLQQAIAAVTEAVNQQHGNHFSLMDHNAWQMAEEYQITAQTVARPRHEALLPFTTRHHSSLFALQRVAEGRNEFRMQHFDSADRRGHHTDRQFHADGIRRRLSRAGWYGHGDDVDRNSTIEGTGAQAAEAMAQAADWTCGLHTIFNAWALALGLRLRRVRMARYDDFIRDGMALVRAAVQGFVSSEDIKALFDCYEFIQAGQAVPNNRVFEHTTAFLGPNDLIDHAARVRIVEDLEAMRHNDTLVAGFPDFNTAVNDIRDVRGEPNLAGLTVQQFIDEWETGQRTLYPVQGGQALGPAGQRPTRGSNESLDSITRAELAASGGTQTQEALLQSFNQSGTAQRTNTETPATGRSTDEAEQPEEPGRQSGSDINGPDGGPSDPNRASTQSSGPAVQNRGSSQEPPSQSNGTGGQAGTTASGDGAAQELNTSANATLTGDGGQSHVPTSTALLNRIPRNMIPGTPEHVARAAARAQEAQAHIAAARLSADRIAQSQAPQGPATGEGAGASTDPTDNQEQPPPQQQRGTSEDAPGSNDDDEDIPSDLFNDPEIEEDEQEPNGHRPSLHDRIYGSSSSSVQQPSLRQRLFGNERGPSHPSLRNLMDDVPDDDENDDDYEPPEAPSGLTLDQIIAQDQQRVEEDSLDQEIRNALSDERGTRPSGGRGMMSNNDELFHGLTEEETAMVQLDFQSMGGRAGSGGASTTQQSPPQQGTSVSPSEQWGWEDDEEGGFDNDDPEDFYQYSLDD